MNAAKKRTAVTVLQIRALQARVDAISHAKHTARRQAQDAVKEPQAVKQAKAVLSAWDKKQQAESQKMFVADNRRVRELRSIINFGDIDTALAEVEKEEKRLGI